MVALKILVVPAEGKRKFRWEAIKGSAEGSGHVRAGCLVRDAIRLRFMFVRRMAWSSHVSIEKRARKRAIIPAGLARIREIVSRLGTGGWGREAAASDAAARHVGGVNPRVGHLPAAGVNAVAFTSAAPDMPKCGTIRWPARLE